MNESKNAKPSYICKGSLSEFAPGQMAKLEGPALARWYAVPVSGCTSFMRYSIFWIQNALAEFP